MVGRAAGVSIKDPGLGREEEEELSSASVAFPSHV